MTVIEYTVSEISARSPDMNDDDFRAFVEDIRRNGQLVPIWVCGGDVIDGRKRLAACREIGVEPKVIDIDPAQDAEAISRALNVLRTHYTAAQRAMFAAERANSTLADTARFRKSTKSEFGPGVVTLEQAATEAGVVRSTVAEAKRIKRDGAPEVAAAVKAGRLSLHSAKEIVKRVPLDSQPVAVEKVIDANRGNARNTPVAKVLDDVDPRKDRGRPKPAHEQFARSVQMLDVAAEVIANNVGAAASDTRRKELLETLRHVRTTITRVINALEIAA